MTKCSDWLGCAHAFLAHFKTYLLSESGKTVIKTFIPADSRRLLKSKKFLFSLFFFWYLSLSFFRHYSLNSGIYDLGIFAQWSYLAGIGEYWSPSSLTEYVKPALGDHFSLLLVPLGLIIRLIPSAYTLLLVQSAGLAILSSSFLGLILSSPLSDRHRWLIVLSVLVNPFFFNSSLNDFHPEIAFSFFGFASLVFLREKQTIKSLVLLSLFVFSKEAMAVFAIGYAIYAWALNRRSLAIGVFLAAIAYFLCASSIVDVFQNYSTSRYGHLGESYPDVLTSLFRRPGDFFSALLNRQSLVYLAGILLPFWAFLCWPAAWPGLFAATPLIIANLLSASAVMRNPIYQYQLPIVLFILVAIIDSFDYLRVRLFGSRLGRRTAVFLVSSTTAFFLLSQWYLLPTQFLRYINASPAILRLEIELSSPQLRVWANERIASHFSARKGIFYRLDDINKMPFDVIISPAYIQDKPPKSILTKFRNLLFSYGDDAAFVETNAIKEMLDSSEYTCQESSILVCRGYGAQ